MGISQPRSVLCQVMKLAWWSIASSKNSVVAVRMSIQSEYIGSLVMEELAELDEITYTVLPVFTVALRMSSWRAFQQITQSSKKGK